MTNNEILQADVLDILFEHRNKSYGAYALRRSYSGRLSRSLGIALSLILAFVFISFLKNQKNDGGSNPDVASVIIREVELEKEKIKEREKPKEQPKTPKSTADWNQIKVVPDDEADKVQPDLDKLSKSVIGDEDSDGEEDDGTRQTIAENTGSGNQAVAEPEPVKQPELPSYPAKFPGDWLGFLQRYLQSPEDLEPGQRVEVIVRFWIDVDGSISKPEIIKSGGASFDKEVLRVLKKMPKWEPAMQAGHPVAVARLQPVIFVGVEE